MMKEKNNDKIGIEKYQEGLMSAATNNMKYGMLNIAGQTAFGNIGSAYPVAKPVTSMVNTGLQLGQIGTLTSASLAVANLPKVEKYKKDKISIKFKDLMK